MACVRPTCWLSYFSRYGHFKFLNGLVAADGPPVGPVLRRLVFALGGRHIILCSIDTHSTIYPAGSNSFILWITSHKYVSWYPFIRGVCRGLWTDNNIVGTVRIVFMRWYASWMMLVMMGVDWQCYLIMWKVYERCRWPISYLKIHLPTYAKIVFRRHSFKALSTTPSMEDAVTVQWGATKSNSESSCLFIQWQFHVAQSTFHRQGACDHS